jgi:prolyl-tRNA synthetase
MTHSDDDGLVLPPRLAPKHVVLLPIYRNDLERSQVLPYCQSLQKQLEEQRFGDEPIRVLLDDRDLRGGEKSWHHVKRGVPLRAEIGPRDIASDGVFLARRDTGEKGATPRGELVATVAERLEAIQQDLYEKADRLRRENTRNIDTADDFRAYFTPQNADKPEIHGGFAMCHYAPDPASDKELANLKVTIRCMPLEADSEPGKCIFTGKPSPQRVLMAKAY